MILDAHNHFWRYTAEEFGWLEGGLSPLRRNFLPVEFGELLASHGVGAAIAVQARQCEAETQWLLDLAGQHEFIAGVVGWVPLASPDIDEHLDRFSSSGKLVGVRHVLQGEPDAYAQRGDFNRGIAALQRYGLVYELLVMERQLPAAIELVDRHPSIRFVLDHLGKPQLDVGVSEPWRTHMRQLARRPNVSCKLSGGVTEANLQWKPVMLRPYFDAALEAFGPGRLMFGSNWPVCEAAGGYGRWMSAVQQWAQPLSPTDRHQLFSAAAHKTYRLKSPVEERA
jgi:L-fuconolactonase